METTTPFLVKRKIAGESVTIIVGDVIILRDVTLSLRGLVGQDGQGGQRQIRESTR